MRIGFLKCNLYAGSLELYINFNIGIIVVAMFSFVVIVLVVVLLSLSLPRAFESKYKKYHEKHIILCIYSLCVYIGQYVCVYQVRVCVVVYTCVFVGWKLTSASIGLISMDLLCVTKGFLARTLYQYTVRSLTPTAIVWMHYLQLGPIIIVILFISFVSV